MNFPTLTATYRDLANKVVTSYKTDIDHDITEIKKQWNPETRTSDFLIFQLRETGTHCTNLWNKEGLPNKKERIPFLFSTATGEQILDQMAIYISCEADKERPHYVFDVSLKTLKKISYAEAAQLVTEQKKRVRRQWDSPLYLVA